MGVEHLVLRMARENPSWGCTRFRGVPRNLGHEIGRNTIKRILADHGIEPPGRMGRGLGSQMGQDLQHHLGVPVAWHQGE